jgi:hypothetical protein
VLDVRVALYFDGRDFHAGWRDRADGRLVDFTRIAAWLAGRVGGARLWSALYYTAVGSGGVGVEAPEGLAGFLDMLESQPGYFVRRLPRRVRRVRCDGCGDEARAADGREIVGAITADLVRDAAQGAFDIAVLLAGDVSYAPAATAARTLGRQVWVATWGGAGLSQGLRKAAFGHLDLAAGLSDFAQDAEGVGAARSDPGGLCAPGGEGGRQAPRDRAAERSFLDDLGRAEDRFDGGYVGLSYFVTRWRSDRLTPSANERRRLLDRLVDDGRVEIYAAPDGSKAIRRAEGG